MKKKILNLFKFKLEFSGSLLYRPTPIAQNHTKSVPVEKTIKSGKVENIKNALSVAMTNKNAIIWIRKGNPYMIKNNFQCFAFKIL